MSGRPSKRNDRTADTICKYLSAGNTRKTACICADISEDTFARWIKDDADFADKVKKAEETAVARNVALIQQAAQTGTWQAAAWWLERRRPQDFSIKQVQEHSGGVTVKVVYDNSPDQPTEISPGASADYPDGETV